jgi:hypothetical protein
VARNGDSVASGLLCSIIIRKALCAGGIAACVSTTNKPRVTEVDAALVVCPNDSLPAAVATRELHQLMTGFAPRQMQAWLLDNAGPVRTDRNIFRLSVSATATLTAQVRFTNARTEASTDTSEARILGLQRPTHVRQPCK